MSGHSFPIFDLGSFEAAGHGEKNRLGAEVDRICRSTGFLAIANHGVADTVVAEVWKKTQAFFDLPPEMKQRAKTLYPGYPYGYLGPGTEALAMSIRRRT
jgi:isopenicillin N synthase-like dioxygenase